MGELQKLEGQLELNCCATKLFAMIMAKQPNFAKICTTKVADIQVHQDDGCIHVGSSRRWDCIIEGQSQHIIERIEEVDEENKKIHRKVIDGEILKHYKTLENRIQVTPTGENSCILIYALEYEKVDEDAPEPQKLLDFALSLFKEAACHFTK